MALVAEDLSWSVGRAEERPPRERIDAKGKVEECGEGERLERGSHFPSQAYERGESFSYGCQIVSSKG